MYHGPGEGGTCGRPTPCVRTARGGRGRAGRPGSCLSATTPEPVTSALASEVGPEAAPTERFTVILPSQVTRIVSPRIPRRPSEGSVGMDRVMGFPVVAVVELHRLALSLAQLRALKPAQLSDLGPVRDSVVRVGDRPTYTGNAREQPSYAQTIPKCGQVFRHGYTSRRGSLVAPPAGSGPVGSDGRLSPGRRSRPPVRAVGTGPRAEAPTSACTSPGRARWPGWPRCACRRSPDRRERG